MELYTWQLQRGKVFLHEQPCGALPFWSSGPWQRWNTGIGVETNHLGKQLSGDPHEVCEKNSRKPRREWHKHTSTLTGTCWHAERYPVRLVRAILRGLRRALRRGLPGGGHLCEIESAPILEERGPEEESVMLSSEPDPSGSPWAPTAQTEFFDDLTCFCTGATWTWTFGKLSTEISRWNE